MDQITPMMRQYMEIKLENKEAILLFRLGDFYEMFFDDAITASKVLNITLTSRDKGKGEKVPMAGIPFHAAERYISTLIKAGYKVGICEQVEDPKLAKGLVKRKIVRIITPGTVLSPALLEDKTHNYLASVAKGNKSVGLSFVDLSTGEFKLTELMDEMELRSELTRLQVKECLMPASLYEQGFLKGLPLTITAIDDLIFNYSKAYSGLIDHFKVQSLDGFGLEGFQSAIGPGWAIIHYLKETQRSDLSHINSLSTYFTSEFMLLDQTTQQNLEITTILRGGEKRNSLLGMLDKTRTNMGARLLYSWLQQPLLDVEKIIQRQEAIAQLLESGILRREIADLLSKVYDIERLMSRLDCGLANARDLISLKQSLLIIPLLNEKLTHYNSQMLTDIAAGLEPLDEVTGLIEAAIVDEPALSIREGGLIKPGWNQELDDLRAINQDGRSWVAALQKQEIERTNISSLKVGYNNVFGYYIEVTKPNLHLVPSDYIRKQTVANAERFITPELKERETMILNAQEQIEGIEYNIFLEVRQEIIRYAPQIQRIGRSVACLDVLVSLADLAQENDYVRPEINQEEQILIKDGRHPVVEKFLAGERFVPNDTLLDSKTDQIMIITGPNMAGKSTYIRQVALIVLMAQMGSFVPASQATIGIVDRIFTRVGASDALSKGQSTFMVEMNETANILNNATSKSLIILDEVGRGTSTFDGVSIAWSVVEYLHNNKETQAKTLFATHYHELTELEFSLERVRNYNIAVKEWQDEIIFLHKIVKGGTDRSYGIHVARLAGLPEMVIKRAKEILSSLELTNIEHSQQAKVKARGRKEPIQLSLFATETGSEVVEALKTLEVNTMTPLAALTKLAELKGMVNAGH